MTKYISSIKDLIGQAITDLPTLNGGAEKGVASAVFKMGMIHLLGINTPIDFKKASSYFGNQLLADDSLANQLLGFIAECEGDFKSAFKHYANAAEATGRGKNRPYYNKVFEQRGNVPSFFKEMKLPSAVLNKEISAIVAGYVKGGESKVDASIKIATICNDETSCLEAAQNLFDTGDYYSAKRWLEKGNIASNNGLYVSVKNKLLSPKDILTLSDAFEIITIDGNSLFAGSIPSYDRIRDHCIKSSARCKKEWETESGKIVKSIKKKIDDEEAAIIKEQEELEERRIQDRKDNIKTFIFILLAIPVIFIIILFIFHLFSDDLVKKILDCRFALILFIIGIAEVVIGGLVSFISDIKKVKK